MGGYQEPPTHSPPSPPNKVGGKYTRETYQKAKKLYSEGYGIKEISERLDIPIRTLSDWLLYGAGYKKYLGETRRYSLEEYYLVKQLYREGYTMAEIHRKTGIPKQIIRNWIKRRKQPIDDRALMVRYFCENIIKIKSYDGDYRDLLRNPAKHPYLMYLYGATMTDGWVYFWRGRFKYIGISGEKIFLERINRVVFNLIGRRYSIFKAWDSECFRIRITYPALGLAMAWLKDNFQYVLSNTRDNESNAKALLLGLVDGDGYCVKRGKRFCIGLSKLRKRWLVSYSGYLLRKLGIKNWYYRVRRVNRQHITKYGDKIITNGLVFGWECRADEFLEKIGPTIKVLKRRDLPEYIKQPLKGTNYPIY